MPVKEDLARGHRLIDVAGGSSIVRTFEVTGLTAAPEGQLLEALRDPGIPKVGDQYPGGEPLFVLSVTVLPNQGANGAIVECTYAVPNRASGGTWNQGFPVGRDGIDVKQVSSSLKQVTTFKDAAGNPMQLDPPTSKTRKASYLSEATTLVPVGSLVFERTETAPATDRLRAYVGKLNLLSLGGGAYPARTLLFRAYNESSEDGGRTWNCTYQFDYDPLEWVHWDIWKDERGQIPTDATGIAWAILPAIDFTPLGLDFTDGQTPI